MILLFIAVFTKACELTVLLECFDLLVCKYQALSSVDSYYQSFSLKKVSKLSKTMIIPKSIISFLWNLDDTRIV